MTYEALIDALTECGVPFREGAWDTHPEPPYGVYALDGSGSDLWADDRQEEQVLQGTVDLFVRGRGRDKMALVERALYDSGVSWDLNSIQYESDTRLTHFEWVFEALPDEEADNA